MQLAKTMTAVFQDKPSGALYTKEVPIPSPQKGEVLIRMHASPINPSDLSNLQGTYAHKPNYPYVPGVEGCGTVISSGGGIVANMRKGKFVALSSSNKHYGTWAEYAVTSAMNCIPVSKYIDKNDASMLIVNPLTALSFINIIKTKKAKAIISTAAYSTLGKMFLHLCTDHKIEVLNIVRKEEHIEALKELGAVHVLNSNRADFKERLNALSKKLNVSIAFDAVGGELASTILENIPIHSNFISYAKLSEEDVSVNPRTILQNDLKIEGFYLGSYTKTLPLAKVLGMTKSAKKLIASQARPNISKNFSLNNAQEAVDYYKNNMSEGKVLLSMSNQKP